MTSPTNNKELTTRLRNDDEDAFNCLYWQYHVPVYANAFKLTRNRIVAEDIVQETFFALWNKRHEMDPEQDVAGWLFTVSYHKSINSLKKQLREAARKKNIVQQSVTEESPDEKTDQRHYRLNNLEAAIGHLSPQKRRVFELCKLHGKTYEEAAKELHISKYTVKEYLSGAVVSIKDYLQKHPEQQTLFTLSLTLFTGGTFLC